MKKWKLYEAATDGGTTHLLPILDFSSRSIVGLLKEDLFHFAVLQVVQLSHCVLCSLNKIYEDRGRTFTLQKRVLVGERTEYTSE